MRIAIVIAATILLLGCTGKSVVLKQDAKDLNQLIDKTLKATHDYYAKLGQQRLDFYVDFLAAHPSCGIETTQYYLFATQQCLTAKESLRRNKCSDNINAYSNCKKLLSAKTITVSPSIMLPRQSSTTLLGIIASYQRTLSKVLVDKDYNTAAELNELQTKLIKLQAKIKLSGNDNTPKGTKEKLKKQTDAVSRLINHIRENQQHTDDFAQLQAFLQQKGQVIEQTLEDIKSTYRKADKPISELLQRRVLEQYRRDYNRLSVTKRKALSAEKRQELIKKFYQADFQYYKLTNSPDVVVTGLNELIKSHKDLQQGFKGKFNHIQRKRIAKENHAQLKNTFKSIFTVVKLFS